MCPFNDVMKIINGSSSDHKSTTVPSNTVLTNNDTSFNAQVKPSVLSILFATVAYGYMFAVFVLTFLFTFLAPTSLGGSYVPFLQVWGYNVDQDSTDTATALATNVGTIATFCFFHSLLARNSIKQWMKIPATMERSVFVLQSAFLLHIQMHFWKGFATPLLWDVNGTAKYVIIGVQVFGLLFLLTATFALDHFYLFGLTQAYGVDINKLLRLNATRTHPQEGGIVKRWHYTLVAHPLMTGVLLAFWAVPRMTGSRFLLAVMNTTYITFAVRYLEEPQIQEMVGDKAYTDYLKTVPRYIPFMRPAIPHCDDDGDIKKESHATGESPLPSSSSTPLMDTHVVTYGEISV